MPVCSLLRHAAIYYLMTMFKYHGFIFLKRRRQVGTILYTQLRLPEFHGFLLIVGLIQPFQREAPPTSPCIPPRATIPVPLARLYGHLNRHEIAMLPIKITTASMRTHVY